MSSRGSCETSLQQGIFEGMEEEPSKPAKRGKRRGRPKSKTSGVSHQKRGPVVARYPWHVTMKIEEGLPSLRGQAESEVVIGAIADSCTRAGRLEEGSFRIVHFSVMDDHVHLLCEGNDQLSFSRGMNGFATRMAKRLNKLWGRKGKVYAHRYHARELRTPTESFHALRYVVRNAEKHGRLAPGTLDTRSSGVSCDIWEDVPFRPRGPCPVAQPQSWLLREGWKKAGRMRLWEPWSALDAHPGPHRGVRS